MKFFKKWQFKKFFENKILLKIIKKCQNSIKMKNYQI